MSIESLQQVVFPPSGDLSGLTNAEVIEVRAELVRLRGEFEAWCVSVASVTAIRSGRDAAATLCRELGVSAARSRELLDAASAADASEVVADALAAGLGVEKARSLKGLSDEATARLLREEGRATVDEFRVAAEKVRVDETAGKERSARQRAQRGVSFFRGPDGCVGIRSILPTLDGARVRQRLTDIADAAYRAEHPERAETVGGHRAEGLRERLADALVHLATGDAPASGKPSVVIVVDEARLTAEVVNEGPVSMCEVADLIRSTKTDLYAAVRGMKGEILNFGRSRRFATVVQRLALIVRDGGTCAQPGCTVRWDRCHAHHRVPVDEGGLSDLVNFEHECTAHHQHEHDHRDDHWDATGPPSRPLVEEELEDAA